MVNLIDLFQQKLEIFRLEQRYIKRRNRRSTFVSEAQYVDGEYVYSPTSSYATKCSAATSESEVDVRGGVKENETGSTSTSEGTATSKGSRRLSRMSMGLDKMDWKRAREEKRQSRINVLQVKWDDVRA